MMIMLLFMQAKAITWSVNRTRLTNHTFFDGYPAIAQTNDGKIWLLWAKEAMGNLTLHYMTSNDLGQTWSSDMNLTNLLAPGHNQNPSIMQAQNNTIWVAWTSDRPPPPSPPTPDFNLTASPQNLTIPQGESQNSTIIVTSLYDFNDPVNLTILTEPTGVNTTFSPPQVAPPPNEAANSTLIISVNSTATPGNYTLTVLGKGDHLMHTTNLYLEIILAGSSSQTHIEELAPSFGPARSTSIPLIDKKIDNRRLSSPANIGEDKLPSESAPDAPFVTDYEIYYKTSNDYGTTWSKDIQLTDNSIDDLRPSILQLTNGTIMIFWQTYISGNHNIVYTTTTDGTSWSTITQLTTDPYHDKGPAATQTKDGKIWTVWASTRTGNYDIYYKNYNGTTWTDDTQLTTSPGSDVAPVILQSLRQEIFIFWAAGNATGSYDIYYKRSLDNGLSWSSGIEFIATAYQDQWPAITQTNDAKIWLAWMSNEADQPDGNWEIYCRTSLSGDVNEDHIVDSLDLDIISTSIGYFQHEPEYDTDADITQDGIVDVRDLAIVIRYLNET
jgi:hypothetical protein